MRAAIRNLVFERSIDAGHNDLYDHPDFAQAAREALMRVEGASGEALGHQWCESDIGTRPVGRWTVEIDPSSAVPRTGYCANNGSLWGPEWRPSKMT